MSVPRIQDLAAGDAAAVGQRAAALAALFAGLPAAPWRAAEIAALAAASGGLVLLASALDPADGIEGGLLARRVADESEVLLLAVAPRRRRAGWGGALLAAAMGRLAAAGARRLSLEVAADNAAAIALYRKAGLVVAGHRPAYYPAASSAADLSSKDLPQGAGARIDALIMTGEIAPPLSPLSLPSGGSLGGGA